MHNFYLITFPQIYKFLEILAYICNYKFVVNHPAMNNHDEILNLLRREVVPAVGCTEPVAVAFAVARACECLDSQPSRVELKLSANVLKNAMGVGIPGTGMVGLPIAIALAIVVGRSSYGLEVLKDATAQDVERAKEYMVSHSIDIKVDENAPDKLYIDVCISTSDAHSSRVIIAGQHTNIILEEVDGEPIVEGALLDEQSASAICSPLSMRMIHNFATAVNIADISFIMEAGRLNSRAAEMALEDSFGHNIGKIFSSQKGRMLFGDSRFTNIVSFTTAACDARMAGAMIPVMSNSGSGNQGIAATLPVYMYAQQIAASEEALARALVLSSLTAIYIKQRLGRLSALCGCVVAATGSSCGITYLMGGDYAQITYAVKNMVANLTGMICDGAKPSCSLKLASGVSTALLSALLALEGCSVSSVEGIVENDVDKCIENLARIGRDSMTETDRLVLNIMTNKSC